jgi:hypothetical protein
LLRGDAPRSRVQPVGADVAHTRRADDQVTAVFVVLVTVAVNCCVPDWYSDTADGASVTKIGLIAYVTELTALFNSPLLYATALIVVVAPTVIGPVYSAPIVALGTLPSVV